MKEIRIMGFYGWLKFIWKAHITNWFWRTRNERRQVRKRYNMEAFQHRLAKYIPFIQNLEVPAHDSQKPGKETVFSIWFQGYEAAPEIVRKCLDSMKKMFGSNFILLDKTNYVNYVTLPPNIISKWEKGKIRDAHIADILRLELLRKFGGYWMDATDFVTGTIPDEIKELPFFMYMADQERTVNMYVQNCFIHSDAGYPLVEMWLSVLYEYWKNEDLAVNYFFGQNLFRLLVTHNAEAKKLFEKMPKIDMSPTHVLWHKIGNHPFSEEEYQEMKKNAFFQKCTHKRHKHGLNNIRNNSLADFVINGKTE